MSESINPALLLLALAWPLLLAIPALHSRLPWPHHLAILPAVILTLLPGDTSLELPRLLFGTGLAVDGENRWMLAMAAAIWLMVATMARPSRREPAPTLFMLTLTGNLGAILSSDLVSFFSSATLMGYGYYGLLVQTGGMETRRAARLYLLFLVVADLALFEALLLAASSSADVHFAVVRQVMATAPSAHLYLGMVLGAFALKAGVWPFHRWLVTAYRSAPLSSTLLLGAVPVAMGLFGAIRWLPLGEQPFALTGGLLQLLGVAAMLYAAVRLFSPGCIKRLPAWSAVAMGGLFMLTLGIGLAHPALWLQYRHLAPPGITLAAILLAALSITTGRLHHLRQRPAPATQDRTALPHWYERLTHLLRWPAAGWLRIRARWQLAWRQRLLQLNHLPELQQTLKLRAVWGIGITLFLLMGLALAWLAG